MTNIFEGFLPDAYPHRYNVTLEVADLAGGTPTDPKTIEGWLKTKLGIDSGEQIRDAVAAAMIERGLNVEGDSGDKLLDEAVEQVAADRHLNGFKRMDGPGSELCIEGRHLKAMIKEAACIRWPDKRWGPTRKGTKSFFAEHFFVAERWVGLGVSEPTRIDTRYVHTFRGDGIQREEIVDPAVVRFTLYTDVEMKRDEWGLLFLTGGANGLGSSRSQSYGTFAVTDFVKAEW